MLGPALQRLLALLGAALGLLLTPLALAGPTAWLLLPVHLLFTVLASVSAAVEGWGGHPVRARLWGMAYVVCTLLMVGALELGSGVRGGETGWFDASWSGWFVSWLYWGPPWMAALVWGWIPPTIAGLAGWLGEWRLRRLNRLAIARRRSP